MNKPNPIKEKHQYNCWIYPEYCDRNSALHCDCSFKERNKKVNEQRKALEKLKERV